MTDSGAVRRALGVVVTVVLLVTACGGGDDGDAVELDAEPIASVEACDLLDEDTASDLAGADVELVSDAADPNACEFAFTDDTLGTGVAASLRFDEGDESDVPGGGVAGALDLGDAGAVEADDTTVKVVYVVREVVVFIEVAPAGGVDDEVIDRVVDFAERTEAPVVEAVTGEAPAEDEPTTTTATTEAQTTTTESASGTVTTIDGVDTSSWGATAVAFRDQIGEQFVYTCPPGGPPGTVWGNPTEGYTDDSSVCTASVHAGLITVEDGGRVRIQMTEGRESYTGTTANGITTLDWPTPWPASFLPLVEEG